MWPKIVFWQVYHLQLKLNSRISDWNLIFIIFYLSNWKIFYLRISFLECRVFPFRVIFGLVPPNVQLYWALREKHSNYSPFMIFIVEKVDLWPDSLFTFAPIFIVIYCMIVFISCKCVKQALVILNKSK